MQELIKELKDLQESLDPYGLHDAIEFAESMLEKEKEQIIDAVKYGYKKDYYTPNFREQQELFEQYYEQTYGGNK